MSGDRLGREAMTVRKRTGGEPVGVAVTSGTPGLMILAEMDGRQDWVRVNSVIRAGDELERVDWWGSMDELQAVMGVAIETAVISDLSGALYFVQKPWKWDTFRNHWVTAGRPLYGEDGWDRFVEAIQEDGQ